MTHLVPVIRPVLGTPFRRDSLYRRAGAMPSFHIAPARTQTAADLITGSVLGSYNSATPAMAVGPDGLLFTPAANAPVIEYDPTTLSCLGARVWGVVTNINPVSSYAVGSWTFQAASLGSATKTSPTGSTLTAFLSDATTTAHRVTRSLSGSYTANSIYTYSFFVAKPSTSDTRLLVARLRTANGGQAVRITISNNGEDSTYAFTGSVPFGTSPPPAVTASDVSIVAYANKWYKISITTAVSSATTTFTQWDISFSSSTAGETIAGTANTQLFIDAVQVSPGGLAPYVPTTSTTASSTADVWDLTNLAAGANNIRSLYARVRTPASGTSGIISLNDNSSSNRIALQTTGTSAKLVAVTSGSTVADITGGTISANTVFNIAARIVGDDYAVSVNGSPVVTDTAGATAVVDRIFFGRTQAGEYLNGYIEECAGWTQYPSDSQLQAVARS